MLNTTHDIVADQCLAVIFATNNFRGPFTNEGDKPDIRAVLEFTGQ